MTEHEPTYEELLERCRRAEGMLAAIRSGQVDTVLGDSQTLVVRLDEAERRLQERIKELDCLYGLSRLVESGASLPVILQGMADLIPVSWKHPEIARTRILLDGVAYRSHENCGQSCEDCTFDHQRRTIRVDGAEAGEVCVAYAEPRPPADEGPFLAEERALINAVAERLGHVIERFRLLERMERRRRIVEDSPTVLFRWAAAPDWPVEYVSENVKRFGYAPEEFLSGRVPYASIVHPDDLERVSNEVRRHAESGEAEFGQEYRIRARDGTIHWVDDRTTVVRSPEGEVVAFEGMVLDITHRKRADAALRDSEARFRTLAEHMPVLVNAITEAGVFTFWNRACEEVTGYGKDEMVGTPDGMAQLYPDPAHRERLAGEWQEAGGVFRDKEITLQAKDGSERTIVWTNLDSPFSFTERDTWAIGVDITERKRAEEAVQQAKARLEATLESIGDGFFSLDEDLVVTYFNTAAERLLGRPRDEVLGQPLFDAFPQARGSVFEQNYRRALREKERQSFEVNFAVAPYQNWYEVSVYPQEDGISVYFQVVTERKQAEAALRRSEENHRTTLNSIGDAVIATDIDGNVREMNPVAEALTGWPLAEAVGRPLEEVFRIVNAQTRATVRNPVSKVLATGRVVGLANHTILVSRDGAERQIADSAAPIRNDDGMTSGVVLVFRDVTEEYAAAEALRDSEAELRRAQVVAQVGSWRFHLDAGTVTASDEARRIYGLGSREWTIEEVQTVPLPEYRDRLDQALREVVERGKPYDLEFRIRRPSDGAVRDIHSVAEYDAAHNRVIGTIQDITDRKATERALRDNEEHLRSIFRVAPVGIGVVVSRMLRQVNDEVCEMTGYTQDELVGESARMLYPSQQEYEFVGREKYAQIRSRGTGTVETRWLCKDGRIIDVLLSSTPMDLEDLGKGVTFTALDITERKRTEIALRQSEALLEATGRMARVGGWELDAETMQVTWTRETYRIHDVPPGEKPPLEEALSFWHPEDRPILEEAIRRALKEREPYDLELRFITAKGRELHARTMCTPIVENGRVVKLRGTFQDITERKRAEEELETIFEMSLALICVADIETATFTRINPAFRTVLGYEEDELLSRTFLDFVHPDDIEPTRRVVEESLRQGREVFSFENRYRCKDGSYRWLTWNSHSRPEESVTYAVAVDVTESKEAEQALRESEARYRVLMEQTGDVMLVHDLDANLIDVNDFACTTYGYTRDELLQMNIRDLDPDYKVREDGGASWEGLELYKPILIEVRQRKKSGDIFPAEVRLSLIKYHGATVVLGFCRDISERNLAEQALRESEEHFRNLFENMNTGVAVYDAVDDGEDFVFVDLNAAGERFSHITREEVAGRRVTEVFPAVREIGLLDAFRRAHATGEPQYLPLTEYRDERIQEWVENRVYSLPSGRIVAMYEDRTEQHLLAERLRQMEKMDAIGQLAGGVAHDFNNQLGGIMGYADMLLERLDEPTLKRYTEGILVSAQRAADLTKQLLAFSRKGQYRQVPVDLHDVIHEAVEILKRSIDRRIEIRRHLNASPAVIEGDPSQIQNALLNLALNARDAMPEGGELRFETDVVELDEAYCTAARFDLRPGAFVRVRVCDTGCGMPPEVREHIFEPFYTTKEVGKGTGMGLAAVYGTVTQHHGAINVYSEPDEGTVFTLYLPVTDASAAPSPVDVADASALRGRRVLVIDDEEVLRAMAVDMLEALGCLVRAEADGGAGVAYFREHAAEVDLVILDMIMPRLAGKDVFPILREIDPDARILLASGYSASGGAEALLAEGAAGFLQKPFQQTALVDALLKALQSPERD